MRLSPTCAQNAPPSWNEAHPRTLRAAVIERDGRRELHDSIVCTASASVRKPCGSNTAGSLGEALFQRGDRDFSGARPCAWPPMPSTTAISRELCRWRRRRPILVLGPIASQAQPCVINLHLHAPLTRIAYRRKIAPALSRSAGTGRKAAAVHSPAARTADWLKPSTDSTNASQHDGICERRSEAWRVSPLVGDSGSTTVLDLSLRMPEDLRALENRNADLAGT